MRIQFLIWLFVSFSVAFSIALPGLAFAAPEIGEPAPDFSMQGSDGNTYSLEQLVTGDNAIVIAFFPKAFTGG